MEFSVKIESTGLGMEERRCRDSRQNEVEESSAERAVRVMRWMEGLGWSGFRNTVVAVFCGSAVDILAVDRKVGFFKYGEEEKKSIK